MIVMGLIGIAFVVLLVGIVFGGLKNKGKTSEERAVEAAKNKPRALTAEEKTALAAANSCVTQLRLMTGRVRDKDVRRGLEDVCTSSDSIIKALKADPTEIHSARRVLNYYLPSTNEIMTKYLKLEGSGTDVGSMPKTVSTHLTEIKDALDKQYKNIFAADKLDLTVDMKAMSISFKRDGLIGEDFKPSLESVADIAERVTQDFEMKSDAPVKEEEKIELSFDKADTFVEEMNVKLDKAVNGEAPVSQGINLVLDGAKETAETAGEEVKEAVQEAEEKLVAVAMEG